MKSPLYLLLLMISGMGCQTDLASPADLQKYCNQADNGLMQSNTVGDYSYQIQFIPLELQALRSLNKNNINPSTFQEALDKVNGHHYFNLSIQYQKTSNEKITQKLSKNKGRNFHLGDNKDDFRLSIGEQVMPCMLYHVEPISIFPNQIKLTLVFRDDTAAPSTIFKEDLAFHFDDNFLSNQAVKIIIPKSYLNNIPRLKI